MSPKKRTICNVLVWVVSHVSKQHNSMGHGKTKKHTDNLPSGTQNAVWRMEIMLKYINQHLLGNDYENTLSVRA